MHFFGDNNTSSQKITAYLSPLRIRLLNNTLQTYSTISGIEIDASHTSTLPPPLQPEREQPGKLIECSRAFKIYGKLKPVT